MPATDRIPAQAIAANTSSHSSDRVVPTTTLWWFVIALSACPLAAYATEPDRSHPSEAVFLLQLLLLILVGRLLGEAFMRLGQPAVTGQLVAGILLGSSVLGVMWPQAQHYVFPAAKEQKAMLDAVSQVGILLLLMLTGMDTDLRFVRRAGFAAACISITGVLVPFVLGFAFGEFLPDTMVPKPELRTVTSLFLGTALAIASIKIVAVVVREMNYMRRNLGKLIVSSAIIDDALGWIIISIIFSIAQHGTIDPIWLARAVVGIMIFLAVSLTVGRRVVFFLIRWTNDNFKSELPVLSAILLIMGSMALITDYIGVHTVLGAFVAGILIGESPILTRQIDEQLRGLITAFFAPVFFGAAGLGTDLTILRDPILMLLTLGLILIASIGKFAGAFLGGKLGGLNGRESFALALGMNARGSTEVIIATIGLSLGLLSQDLFSMIVAMAIATTMAMPPTLRWALKRVPIRKDEEARLEREAFAERSFVGNFERLLLAVDDSPNGQFASRIAGLVAGALGAPITVLPIDKLALPATRSRRATETAKATVKRAAQQSNPLEEDERPRPKSARDVEVTIRSRPSPPENAVADEERKGYDMLLIGLERTTSASATFDEYLSRIAVSFGGPIAVIRAGGKHIERPTEGTLNILVLVAGNAVSRRGAEIAFTLARAGNARCTALFVAADPTPNRKRGRLREWGERSGETAVLKDIMELADNLNTRIKAVRRADASPEEMILREARRGGHDLIVIGVSRQPGERLFLGELAASILQNEGISVLLVASESYGHERARAAATQSVP
ncbi:MAG: cation:proton antiporter [Bradyrhizobium sp.]|nr:cation:proton antiporter [Bradyrhizobium sp.]